MSIDYKKKIKELKNELMEQNHSWNVYLSDIRNERTELKEELLKIQRELRIYKALVDGNSQFSCNYTEEDKVILKKIYKKMAFEFHPDRNKEDGSVMIMINSLKDSWGI